MPTIDIKDLVSNVRRRTTNVINALPGVAKDVADHVRDEAFENAPISPTQKHYNEVRQIKKDGSKRTAAEMRKLNSRREKLRATLKQKAIASGKKTWSPPKAAPGGLQDSITAAVRGTGHGASAEVFVASNSNAVKYARRIHDEKGKTWKNRGPGTVQKGARADDKFIERAVNDAKNSGFIRKKINEKLGSVKA